MEIWYKNQRYLSDNGLALAFLSLEATSSSGWFLPLLGQVDQCKCLEMKKFPHAFHLSLFCKVHQMHLYGGYLETKVTRSLLLNYFDGYCRKLSIPKYCYYRYQNRWGGLRRVAHRVLVKYYTFCVGEEIFSFLLL